MTKMIDTGPVVDYAEIERVRRAAEIARAEHVSAWINSAGHAIADAFRTLDRWFEGARALSAAQNGVTGRATPAEYPAVFGGNPDRVTKPANDDKHVAAA